MTGGAINQAQSPKVASPLQREIGQLQMATEQQEKTIAELLDKLRPLFQQQAECPSTPTPMSDEMAEIPKTVNQYRRQIEGNTEQLQFLLRVLEI